MVRPSLIGERLPQASCDATSGIAAAVLFNVSRSCFTTYSRTNSSTSPTLEAFTDGLSVDRVISPNLEGAGYRYTFTRQRKTPAAILSPDFAVPIFRIGSAGGTLRGGWDDVPSPSTMLAHRVCLMSFWVALIARYSFVIAPSLDLPTKHSHDLAFIAHAVRAVRLPCRCL
jgi:hypothetical protein